MSALSVVLLIFSFHFSLLSVFPVYPQAVQQHTGLPNIGYRTLPKIWGGTFLVQSIQSRGVILN